MNCNANERGTLRGVKASEDIKLRNGKLSLKQKQKNAYNQM